MATRAARTETTYEVYLLEGKRWQLHARYRSHERDSALAEAKDLDRRGEAHGVKVVREVFYPDYNKTEEAVIFVGQRAARQNRLQDAELGDVTVISAGEIDEGRGEGSLSGGYIAWRIIVITVMSLGFGVLAALATSMIMGYLASNGIASQFNARTVVFVVFIVAVVAVALPMLITLVMQLSRAQPEDEYRPAARAPSSPVKSSPAKPKSAQAKKEEYPVFTFDDEPREDGHDRSYSVERHDDDGEDQTGKTPWWKFPWFGSKERSAEEQSLLFPGGMHDEDEAPSAPALPSEAPAFSIAHEDEPEDETVPPEPEAEPESPAADFEQQRLFVMRFLGGAIAAIKGVRPQLDASTKFAFDLALAGGCEVVAQKSGLGERDKREILRESVEMVGTKPELARTFADKYESYFTEPRYKQMADLGREAMTRFLSGDPQPFQALSAAIESWDKPQLSLGAQQSITTIFFTDMVGSTNMTQEKGDFAVQELVRRHNAIVRSALAEHGGREVKHTGDGIMATCPTAASAVQACTDIQRAIQSFNATNPMIPLEVRIGVNAGEMIVEENDVFGTTVQMAARICAAAKPRQILVSQAVRDLASSRADSLKSVGQATLKGFKDPVLLFEVVWQTGPAPQAPASEPGTGEPSMPFFPQSQPQ